MKFSEVNWLSRKLIGASILFIASIVFLVTGHCDMPQWMEFNKWIFGIYAAGNIGSKITNR